MATGKAVQSSSTTGHERETAAFYFSVWGEDPPALVHTPSPCLTKESGLICVFFGRSEIYQEDKKGSRLKEADAENTVVRKPCWLSGLRALVAFRSEHSSSTPGLGPKTSNRLYTKA